MNVELSEEAEAHVLEVDAWWRENRQAEDLLTPAGRSTTGSVVMAREARVVCNTMRSANASIYDCLGYRLRTGAEWEYGSGTIAMEQWGRITMEQWGRLLLIIGAAMMTTTTVIEGIKWHQRRAPPAGIRRVFAIGVVLMGMGAVLMGIAPVPGGF